MRLHFESDLAPVLAMPRPREPATLVEMLDLQAAECPDRVAFRFGELAVTFGALAAASGRCAARLLAAGVERGARVVLVLPNGPAFFATFYGAQRAGAVPVPVYPESGLDRVADLAALCGASAVVLAGGETPEAATEELARRLEARPAAAGARVLRAAPGGPAARSVAGDAPADPASWPAVSPDEPALLQYTSGSTGDPKGVIVSHAMALTNVAQMIAGMEITAADRFVSWLPVHHDMGLVLMTLVPFFLGAPLVLLPTTLTDVRRWLAAIERHRGTFTAAPDFAYRLALRSVRDPSRYDLSSLRVALDAAEPVRAETIRRFEETFGLSRVVVAGYGLAEATVGVSMQPPGTAPVVSERGLVAVGRPFPGVRIEIVARDGASREVAAGEVGELLIVSPANTPGYFRNPRATAALFARPGVIRTGDLGFRDDAGNVFLVGRAKNVIIQAGRNLAPQEIEEAVEALAFVRRAAAVGIDRGRAEGEQAVVFAELRRAAPPPAEELEELARQVVVAFHDRLGLRPGRVVLLAPRSIPLTANGKLRHAALRRAWLDGTLRAAGRIVFPEG